jgi:MYXO-CTERM domain-containing protein
LRLRGRIERLYPGGSFCRVDGNPSSVRIMFAIYALLILGGLALWIGVGLVVD